MITDSKAEATQGNETIIESFSNFEIVSSGRDREASCNERTQDENEMQMWTKNSKKLPELRTNE